MSIFKSKDEFIKHISENYTDTDFPAAVSIWGQDDIKNVMDCNDLTGEITPEIKYGFIAAANGAMECATSEQHDALADWLRDNGFTNSDEKQSPESY